MTVVDAKQFPMELKSSDTLKQRKMEAFKDDSRVLAELLIDQVEFANTIIVNKCDLVDQNSISKLKTFLLELNPKAKILCTSFTKVNIEEVLDTNRWGPPQRGIWQC